MSKRFRLELLALLAVPSVLVAQARFEITVPAAAHAGPITGRAYVALSKSSDGQRTPIQQTGETGVPLFGVDMSEAAPGRAIVVDAQAFGFPVRSLRDVPAGEYWVQPFVNVYTKFARADGHTVWLHMDQWEGQHWQRSPGNIYGEPVKMTFDPKSPTPIKLVADKVIPPVQVPADNESVKRIKIQSDILTKWWGQPIYLGATVLLPKDYDKHPDVKYPIVYDEGHFSLGAPGGFGGGRGGAWSVARGGAAAKLHRLLAGRRHAADAARHAPASVALLRRLVRRQLGEQRPVRRRDRRRS